MNIPFLEFSSSQGIAVKTHICGCTYYYIDCKDDDCKLCPKGPISSQGCAVITNDEYIYCQEHYPELFI